jgi:hypothetical protein
MSMLQNKKTSVANPQRISVSMAQRRPVAASMAQRRSLLLRIIMNSGLMQGN